MTTWEKIVVYALATIFVLIAWMGRYQMLAVPTGGQGVAGVAYVLDRWTGTTYALLPGMRRELKEPQRE